MDSAACRLDQRNALIPDEFLGSLKRSLGRGRGLRVHAEGKIVSLPAEATPIDSLMRCTPKSVTVPWVRARERTIGAA